LAFAREAEFDTAYCVLALQNIDDLAKTFAEVKRVLKVGGRFIMVLNHPCFRVLKGSSWGWDEEKKAQYRRVDSYLTAGKFGIEMNPSKEKSAQTISYHRSLQDFFKPLTKAGFAVTRLEEWVSHKVSSPGPRQPAEDRARKEIPLFLMLEARS
ncbi:MAG: methyltransferase domain-containing protein, partial [Patescibacteria group bacterium]